jgi:dihydroneopterin aldolase
MAKHGVLETEKVTPQKFIVDVRIETDQVVTAANSDRIDDALNYVNV